MNSQSTAQANGLSPRDREILRDVIETHVLSGEPVSSRSVARHGKLGLSSASIRNVMADLEDLGLLYQPHTSSGRVPTREGYHLFIGALMQAQKISSKERRYIRRNLEGHPEEPEQILAETSHLLSELSCQIGLVVTPAFQDTVLKTLDFVPLSGSKVLCVVVAASGFVDSKVIETDGPMTREELITISNYLTENFAGLPLTEIRDRLLVAMNDDRAQVDRLLESAIRLGREGLAISHGADVLVDGTEGLLSQPELASMGRIKRLFETFADKVRLVELLNRCIAGKGVRVFIGEDSDLTSELDFSLVTTTYGVGERPLGSLAIFGPSRMEYDRIIPLVHYFGEALSESLAGCFSADEVLG